MLSKKAMQEGIRPNYGDITVQDLHPLTRETLLDQMMAEMRAEMKSPDPDWEKIQDVMGRLVGLKRT